MLHEEITKQVLKTALHYELAIGGLQFAHQVRLPLAYQGIQLDAGYRIDFLVENCVVVELKAVEKLLPLHRAQVLSYLKLSGRPVGLLINFNVPHLRHGIRRVVNGYGEQTHDSNSVSSVSSVVDSSREVD